MATSNDSSTRITRARKSAPSSDEPRRAGALAAMLALRKLIAAVAVPCGDAAADYFTKRHEDAKAFAASLGPMSPYLDGAITALAECWHLLETTGEPNLEVWRPVSAMTESELQEEIADMEKALAEDLEFSPVFTEEFSVPVVKSKPATLIASNRTGWSRMTRIRNKEAKTVEGHLMGDHVHICISIPPKYAVSNVVGYLKGKSAIQIARKFGARQKNFTGEHFWARGYFVSTVGLDENMVRAYIRNQEDEDERYDQMKLEMG